MSWQSKFDAKGPNWIGNIAAIEEEKRLRKFMEELKNEKVEPITDPVILEKLDQEMKALHKEEQSLLHHLAQCESEQEKLRIHERIGFVRKLFFEIKERYVLLRQA